MAIDIIVSERTFDS